NGGDRCAGDRREQAAAQRVADRVAESGLERLDDEPAPILGDLFLGESGTLCDEHYVFLSITCPLYDMCGMRSSVLGGRLCRSLDRDRHSRREIRRGDAWAGGSRCAPAG